MNIRQNILININEKAHKLSSYELWQQQINNMSNDQLNSYLDKLYKQYNNFDDDKDLNIPPKEYQELMSKIQYVENKLGRTTKFGRILN